MASGVLVERNRSLSEVGGSGPTRSPDNAAAEAARRRAIEAAKQRAEQARRLAEEARRAAAELSIESRRQKAIELSQKANAATREVTRLTGQNLAIPFPDAETSDLYVKPARLMDLGSAPPAADSSLLDERFNDGSQNCLDLAAGHVLAKGLGRDSSVIFLKDTRQGPDGDAGHVVVEQPSKVPGQTEIYDPTSHRSYDSLEQYLQANPQYREAGRVAADKVADIAQTDPRTTDRQKALDAAGVSDSLRKLRVADPEEGGQGRLNAGGEAQQSELSVVREREVPPGDHGLRAQEIADRILGPNATSAQRAKAYQLVDGLLGSKASMSGAGAATGESANTSKTPEPSRSREPSPDQVRKLFQEQGLPVNGSPNADRAAAEVDRVLGPGATPAQRRQAYAIATQLADEQGGIRDAGEESALGVAASGFRDALSGKSAMSPSDFDRALVQKLQASGIAASVPPDAVPADIGARWQSASAGLPLTEEQRSRLDQIAAGDRGEAAQRDLLKLLEATEGSSPEARAAMLGKASESKEAREQIQALVASDGWRGLSPEDQTRLGDIVKEVGPDGLKYVSELLTSGKLQDKDKDGRSLLDNLAQLARQELNPVLTNEGKVTKDQLLTSVLQETADPSQVNQGSYGTCSQTSVQYALLMQNPSEYVRLMRGLAGTSGKVDMAGGDSIGIQHEYYRQKHKDGDTRSPSEVIFQGALMEYANGSEDYNAATDENSRTLPIVGKVDKGRGSTNQNTAQQIFDRPYGLWIPTSGAEKRAGLEYLKANPSSKGGDPILLSFNGTDSSHAVTFVEVKDGRVYIRNPWGPGQFADYEQFGLKLEDANTGMYSMSEDDFRKHLKDLTLSRDNYTQATKKLPPTGRLMPLGG